MKHTRMLWTREEEEQLRALMLSGKSKEAVAKKLNRTPTAIQTKAGKLKLPLRRPQRREMTQISELVGSGKILIDKMPRGSVEYWITVHRADDDTTSGQGSIHDQYSHPARIVADRPTGSR